MPWKSVLRYGKFVASHDANRKYEFAWKESVLLTSYLNDNQRALMFNDLIAYCGKLYSADSATGVLYELSQHRLIPRQILMSGDGMNSEGFQSSWTSIKGGIMYIGSKGLSSSSKYATSTPKSSWITIVDPSGRVNHVNWEKEYALLNQAAPPPHSLRHEAVLWSDLKQIWIFLPTFQSLPYIGGSNANRSLASFMAIFIATSDFRSIDVRHVKDFTLPNFQPNYPSTQQIVLQINSAKFLPNSEDNVIVCLLNVKAMSRDDSQAASNSRSFLMMFTLSGLLYEPISEIPWPSDLISSHPDPFLVSYTGIEFL